MSIIVSMLMNVQSKHKETSIRDSSISVINLFSLLKKKPLPRFHLYLAGSYAQLTLLGHPKNNSITSTPKSIPTDLQNGRAPFRMSSSSAERSNSTSSTGTMQPVFDIKKARDQYEKILKQLEVGFDRWGLSNTELLFIRFRRKNSIDNVTKV